MCAGKASEYDFVYHPAAGQVSAEGFEAAVTCYTSDDYAEALALALKASVRDVVIVEGAPPS